MNESPELRNDGTAVPATTPGPPGWVGTAVGGGVGGVAGGFLGMLGSGAYVDRTPSEGWDGLVTVAMWTIIGALVGGGVGAATLLRLRGYARPVASGILFVVLFAICAGSTLAAAPTFLGDWNEDVLITVVGLFWLVISALASRAIMNRGSASVTRG